MMYPRERVREAIIQLGKCARRECIECSHKDRVAGELPSTECKKIANKNINILADVCMCNVPIPPARPNWSKKKDTICWKCAKNGGLCSWSKNFTPVENWKAIPTKIQAKDTQKTEIDSFVVLDCPEFELSYRYKKQ